MTRPTVPHMPWGEFRAEFARDWRQGEHVSYVGPTGVGKTTLALAVLDIRQYVIALANKPADDTMLALHRRQRWPIVREWPPRRPATGRAPMDRLILWPRMSSADDFTQQRETFRAALLDAWTAGGWTVFADEVYYLCKVLGLTRILETYWTTGRSIGVTLVGGTQRPAHVPLFLYDQATHLFLWRDNDETNLRRISGLGGLRSRDIRDTVSALPKHHALYLNTRSGDMVTTVAPKPKA